MTELPYPIKSAIWARGIKGGYFEMMPARAIRVVATGDPDAKIHYLQDHGVQFFVEDRLETRLQLADSGITPILFAQPWNRRTSSSRTKTLGEGVRGRGDNGKPKKTKKAVGSANKGHISSGYGEVLPSIISFGS
jgi:hypothetical protein